MQQAALQFEQVPPRSAHVAPPRLLVEWTPWWPNFFQNIADTATRRIIPDIESSSPPGRFWPDVFVERPPVWDRIVPSFLIYALTLSLMAGYSFWVSRQPRLIYPPKAQTISNYDLSDYLPPVKSEAAPVKAREAKRGEPEYAKQEIISVPPTPDNSTQTIVNPPHPEIIAQEVPLPNMTVWSAPSPQPPVLSLNRARIELPQTLIRPIEAPPDVQNLQRRATNIPQPSVIEPPVDASTLRIKPGQINVAQLNPAIETPALPMPTQRAVAPIPSPDISQDVPPAPSTQGLTGGRVASGQLMALSVRPAAPTGDIQVPNASRSGVFAAGPTGTVGAPGTPNIPGADGPNPTGGRGDGDAATPSGTTTGASTTGVPPGISVSGGTTPANAGAVVAAKPATPLFDSPSRVARDNNIVAANRVPENVRPPAASTPADRQIDSGKKIEEQVFGPKRYYQMQINMANFTSAGGSWIIRFAEMDGAGPGELETPDAIRKVDPAYPPDLIRDRVGGMVALYAVIQPDGSVADVRILQGFNDRLDENARKALLKWQFRPAMKNGAPIAMQAVVYIPFHPPARRVF